MQLSLITLKEEDNRNNLLISCSKANLIYFVSKEGKVHVFSKKDNSTKTLELPNPIIQISCFGEYTFALDYYGNVWYINNVNFEYKFTNSYQTYRVYQYVKKSLSNSSYFIDYNCKLRNFTSTPSFYRKVDKLSCSDRFLFVFSDDGSIWCQGSNCYGQLGIGSCMDCNDFYEINNFLPDQITSIACGSGHSLFLSKSKFVYSCGSNFIGELGYKTKERHKNPFLKKIEGLDLISVVTCHTSKSICIDIHGKVFTFGEGSNSEISLLDIPPVRFINHGKFSTILQDINGVVWEVETNQKESKNEISQLKIDINEPCGFFDNKYQSLYHSIEETRSEYVSKF